MAIFNILKKAKSTKGDLANNYLSLTITPHKILAYIWNFDEDEKVKTIGFGQKNFPSPEVLIHEAAVAIDAAGEKSNADVSKVVFGLSQNWLENNDLSDETGDILKQLTDDLELQAQAFISLASAINHHYKVEESITPSAVLVGTYPKLLEIHLIENNKVQKTLVERGEPTLQKVEAQIQAIKADGRVLPSKIVLYGADSNDKVCQAIEKHVWENIFIHPPKIEYIEDEQLAKSVAYAQAADLLGREPLATKDEKEVEKIPVNIPPGHIVDSLGFVEGEDILSLPDEDEQSEAVQVLTGEEILESGELRPDEPKQTEPQKKRKISFSISKILDKATSLSWLSGLAFIKGQSKKKIAVILLAFLIILFAAFYLTAQTIKSANVVIKVNGKDYNKDFTAQILTDSQADPTKSQISGHLLTTSVDGSQKAVTSGTKNVGQQATGQVNVFNWTTSPKTFPSGSTIITKNGIKFTTNSDIQVASRSATTPGGSQANVTAVDFGDQGNISAGTDFTFSQYDELLFSAHNDSAFSGGNQKQVTVVSQDDLDKLKKALTDSLSQKAKDQLSSQSNDQNLNDNAITYTPTKINFDKKAGDEASLANLDMTLSASAITFSQDDLKNMLAQNSIDLPQGFTLEPRDIQLSNVKAVKKDKTLNLSGSVVSKLIPKIDTDQLASSITGKSIKDATAQIKQNSDVSDVLINFSPNIPFFSSLPTSKSKIKIQVQTN